MTCFATCSTLRKLGTTAILIGSILLSFPARGQTANTQATAQIKTMGATPPQTFEDDFTADRFLNQSIWSTHGTALKAIVNADTTKFVPVRLAFSRLGMSMAGVDGLYQTTGIQSARSFSTPLTLEAKVMGTVANGNPFALYLVNADGSQHLSLHGNLNRRNFGYYGLGLSYTGLGKDAANAERRDISQAVSVNVWYVIRITVDAGGVGTVVVEDLQGSRLAAENNLTVGTGPFFVVLGQWEGWPHTQGVNEAVWGKVTVSATAETSSSSSSPGAGPVWFGFANEACCLDRQAELRARCGEFKRVYVPPDAGNKFTDLCSHEGGTCENVCDWEGRALRCDAVSQGGRRDGSRIALCRLPVGGSPQTAQLDQQQVTNQLTAKIAQPENSGHSVDFRNFEYRPDCLKKTIRVSNGEWKGTDGDEENYFRIFSVTYGDLKGNGEDEAVVLGACGGVGNFDIGDILIFSTSPTGPRLLAELSPSEWGKGEDDNGGMFHISDVHVESHQLRVSFYAGGSHASPAWIDTAAFQWVSNRLVRTRLDRRPFKPSSSR